MQMQLHTPNTPPKSRKTVYNDAASVVTVVWLFEELGEWNVKISANC